MSKVLERLRKKHGSPVTIHGEKYHVRSLSIGEERRRDAITDKDLKFAFVIGCGLCDESGAPELPKREDETDEQWAIRTLAELSDEIPGHYLVWLHAAIFELSKNANPDTIAKNS